MTESQELSPSKTREKATEDEGWLQGDEGVI